MPLYLALLFKVMKKKGGHEGCIEQVYGLFKNGLLVQNPEVDSDGRLRRDQLELRPEIQHEVETLWPQVTTANIDELTDFKGYQADFLKLFGFGLAGVDYSADVNPDVKIDGLLDFTA